MFKYAQAQLVMGWNGGRVRLDVDQPWYADDPFVEAHPELFADTPKNVAFTAPRIQSAAAALTVEQATAEPGKPRATAKKKTEKATDE